MSKILDNIIPDDALLTLPPGIILTLYIISVKTEFGGLETSPRVNKLMMGSIWQALVDHKSGQYLTNIICRGV